VSRSETRTDQPRLRPARFNFKGAPNRRSRPALGRPARAQPRPLGQTLTEGGNVILLDERPTISISKPFKPRGCSGTIRRLRRGHQPRPLSSTASRRTSSHSRGDKATWNGSKENFEAYEDDKKRRLAPTAIPTASSSRSSPGSDRFEQNLPALGRHQNTLPEGERAIALPARARRVRGYGLAFLALTFSGFQVMRLWSAHRHTFTLPPARLRRIGGPSPSPPGEVVPVRILGVWTRDDENLTGHRSSLHRPCPNHAPSASRGRSAAMRV